MAVLLRIQEMKITVHHISEDDLASRAEWLNDERVNTFQFMASPITLASTRTWFKGVKNNSSRCDLVFKDQEGQSLVMAGLTSISKANFNAEFYIFINPDFQGMGVGKAVTAWMLNYGFMIKKLLRVYLFVDPRNIKALKLYEKLMFTLEGTLRKHRSKEGRLFDMHVYGMLKEEWLTSHHSAGFLMRPECVFDPIRSLTIEV
jgi:RimJ/RimL family protein N-acetyltransferase